MTPLERAAVAAILEDPTAPDSLRRAIRDGLDVCDRVNELYREAEAATREASARVAAINSTEPARIVDAVTRGRFEVDDVLPDHAAHLEAVERAHERLLILRRAVHRADAALARDPYRAGVADVIAWVSDARASTPWPNPLAAHVEAAWKAASSAVTWNLPGLPRRFRFARLPVSVGAGLVVRVDAVHRLAWQYLEAGAYSVEVDDDGRPVVTITGDWAPVVDDLVAAV
jgi:hypothetical protein